MIWVLSNLSKFAFNNASGKSSRKQLKQSCLTSDAHYVCAGGICLHLQSGSITTPPNHTEHDDYLLWMWLDTCARDLSNLECTNSDWGMHLWQHLWIFSWKCLRRCHDSGIHHSLSSASPHPLKSPFNEIHRRLIHGRSSMAYYTVTGHQLVGEEFTHI